MISANSSNISLNNHTFLHLVLASNPEQKLENDYYELPAKTLMYRGDNRENALSFLKNFPDRNNDNEKNVNESIATPQKIHIDPPRFFAYTKEVAETYGKNVYKFTVEKDLKLLALDKNIENFYNSASPEIQDILKNNYGYTENDTDGTRRVRNSDNQKDTQLLKYICDEKIWDGYATDLMTTVDGTFHHEITVCEYNNNISKLVENISDNQANIGITNDGARQISVEDDDKNNRSKMKEQGTQAKGYFTKANKIAVKFDFGSDNEGDFGSDNEGGKKRPQKQRKRGIKSTKKKNAKSSKTMRKKKTKLTRKNKTYKKKQNLQEKTKRVYQTQNMTL